MSHSELFSYNGEPGHREVLPVWIPYFSGKPETPFLNRERVTINILAQGLGNLGLQRGSHIWPFIIIVSLLWYSSYRSGFLWFLNSLKILFSLVRQVDTVNPWSCLVILCGILPLCLSLSALSKPGNFGLWLTLDSDVPVFNNLEPLWLTFPPASVFCNNAPRVSGAAQQAELSGCIWCLS